ncbi:DUF4183 domain-containing protein [Niallia sp. NCCP-28]|uniref:DUF4183 domain-containing protein n=1 Tax=Niallia sp. NCCP-28 TaxID=2934712 RepID=UPI002083BF53|nr:DUF4183 domain-containing protein [Niallia sp. NCCP-28]GKU84367.1 hypothetical protein NCCP28_37630 [Niallia sp. NCCP-28]
MPLKIMKLAITAAATTVTAPTVSRFFYEAETTVTGVASLTIDAADFFTDTGGAVSSLPALTDDNSYIEVYVNGVLQMADLLEYTPGTTGTGQLVIDVPADSTIEIDSPVVLVVTNFTPATDVTITT